MAGDTSPYTGLITSEHQSAPNFMAMIAGVTQAWADNYAVAQSVPGALDIDVAVGDQLDKIGLWVGVSRNLTIQLPVSSVYFGFDVVGLGFDAGLWTPSDYASTGIVSLTDAYYRIVLKAKILNNHWDGDVPDAYALAEPVFAPLGYQLFMQDNCDLTMYLGLFGAGTPDAITWALLTNKILDLKPAGIHIAAYIAQSAPGPIFAFDIGTQYFNGFDQSSWAQVQVN